MVSAWRSDYPRFDSASTNGRVNPGDRFGIERRTSGWVRYPSSTIHISNTL